MTYVKYAAFFRNVNLGHPRCPSKAALEAAFLEAGAADAASFQTNGTVCFALPARRSVRRLLAEVSRRLNASCGLVEPVFVRPLAPLAALVARDPFAGISLEGRERCATLLSEGALLPCLPFATPRGDLELLGVVEGIVLSVRRSAGPGPGNPNPVVEKRTGLPATTRNWSTLVRLVEKFG